MSPKNKQRKQQTVESDSRDAKRKTYFGPRDALGAYIAHPESYPSNVVVYYNSDFVAINDLFPKSTVHLLLLPRHRDKNRLHPVDAFEDREFLEAVKAEVKKLRALAAAELRRRYGKYSLQEKAREEALSADPPPDELPAGRNWEREIMCGIHAHPSMNHLHVHVISVDRYSERLKHRKHYNSFSTPFFIDIEDFPLAPDDPRRDPDHEGYLRWPFTCWRCGKDFGDQFAELKRHLNDEFDQWRRL
ncbi:hypothetical protein ASPZODRAFT_87283 [Penicilliopsis zonata CBS 506.65]|uniref:Aprataxin-like protein n=1 Tax=Penicilliopsis zonata CBS 506.65 TaxID=1073090 RepID=A0A1L9SVE9_9EURO|nr:hypothetical protein ASPZODRAFT_87283 [Penicilliopsis zonata CBS 506.65]OJJ51200.1 hypothetical protein ASPZODRAFT_87283 [Penicilliopsis zonata CBS 506.65]